MAVNIGYKKFDLERTVKKLDLDKVSGGKLNVGLDNIYVGGNITGIDNSFSRGNDNSKGLDINASGQINSDGEIILEDNSKKVSNYYE